MTIADLINRYGIGIDTPHRPAIYGRSMVPVAYTLRCQGRELKGEMHADGTLTCEEVLTSLFLMADAGQEIGALNKQARSSERGLKRLLGGLYEEFHTAYAQDKRYKKRER